MTEVPDSAVTWPCPRCGAAMPPGGEYVTWCEVCDWNVDPSPEVSSSAQRKRRATQRAAAEEVANVRAVAVGAKRRSRRRVMHLLPVALALAVHGVTLLLFGFGVWALFKWPWIVGVPIGLGAMVGAILLAPRPGRLPKDATVLHRADAPALFGLLDEISVAEHAKPLDVFVLGGLVNAASATVGLRRRRVVFFGVPLWLMLRPQERVAVLAHEIAHQVNRDPRRGMIVGSSIESLRAWWMSLHTHGAAPHDNVLGAMAQPMLLLLAHAVRGVLVLQLRLTYRLHRAAEYAADVRSAEVASTDAAVRALDRSFAARSCMHALTRASRSGDGSLWTAIADWRESFPEREHERLRRLDRRTPPSMDDSHPPTSWRIEVLQATPIDLPAVALDDERSSWIDLEILAAATTVETQLRDLLRDPAFVF